MKEEIQEQSPTKYPKFGEAITRALRLVKLKQNKLARLIKKNNSTVSLYCSGGVLPSRDAFDCILQQINDPGIRSMLIDAYTFQELFEDPYSYQLPSNKEYFQQVDQMVNDGLVFQALGTAEQLLEETLDPIMIHRLEDLIFTLLQRLKQHGYAMLLSKNLSTQTGQTRLVASIRSLGMRGFALRAAREKSLLDAKDYLEAALRALYDNIPIVEQDPYYSKEYRGLLEREYCKVLMDLARRERRKDVAVDCLKRLERGLTYPVSNHDLFESKESAARLLIHLGEYSKVEEIIEEINVQPRMYVSSLPERSILLRGSLQQAMEDIASAKATYKRASKLCYLKSNLHHAHVAQVAMTRLESFRFVA